MTLVSLIVILLLLESLCSVEIIGVGEVEMSNNNVISTLTPFYDERFGGVISFEAVSGTFDHWEIVSTTGYVYDPYVDTLVIDLQSDVVVKAYFGKRGCNF